MEQHTIKIQGCVSRAIASQMLSQADGIVSEMRDSQYGSSVKRDHSGW